MNTRIRSINDLWNISLPPPEGHNLDCLCEHCFEVYIGREDYSLRVLGDIARDLIGILRESTVVWLIWDINKKLPYPISESALFKLIEGAASAEWTKSSPFTQKERANRRKAVAVDTQKLPKKQIKVEL